FRDRRWSPAPSPATSPPPDPAPGRRPARPPAWAASPAWSAGAGRRSAPTTVTSTRRSGSVRPRSTSSSVLGSSSTVRPGRSLVPIAIVLLVSLARGASAGAAEYKGPLIDAHSHLPNARAIDAYVEAMKRHNVVKVVLLGVGGVQKDD